MGRWGSSQLKWEVLVVHHQQYRLLREEVGRVRVEAVADWVGVSEMPVWNRLAIPLDVPHSVVEAEVARDHVHGRQQRSLVL